MQRGAKLYPTSVLWRKCMPTVEHLCVHIGFSLVNKKTRRFWPGPLAVPLQLSTTKASMTQSLSCHIGNAYIYGPSFPAPLIRNDNTLPYTEPSKTPNRP